MLFIIRLNASFVDFSSSLLVRNLLLLVGPNWAKSVSGI